MLCMNTYPQDYIDGCRARIDADVAAFGRLADPGDFEPVFFNNLVVALEMAFCHRTRGVEKKDGNPLNEVRMLCVALMQTNGRLEADRTIKWRPETTVLGYQIGDEIRLTTADFSRLSKAFFAELESKYLRA